MNWTGKAVMSEGYSQFIFSNKNAFQWDAYRPLQWPPLDVSTEGSPSGGGGGELCL